MPSFVLPVTHVSGTPVTYVPSLYRGDKGEGETISSRIYIYFFTPTFILPRQGGGINGISGCKLARTCSVRIADMIILVRLGFEQLC
jgi:hypothetical protein